MTKFKTNFKKILLYIMFVVFFVSPILTGCDFSLFSSSKLKTPIISVNASNKCLTWKEIYDADNYDIYCNDTLCDTISAGDSAKAVYDFSTVLVDTGNYTFYIVATSTNIYKESSGKSNTITYSYTKKDIISPATPDEDIDGSKKITFSISNGVLSYLPLDINNATYKVFLYSNSSGLKSYDLTANTVDLQTGSYMTKSEIYAIRMGYTIVDGESKSTKIASDIQYYNNIPTQYTNYTDNIYLFDGEIHDYYIESLQELNNIVYYCFVNRITDYTIRISDDFKDFVAQAFGYTNMLDNIDYAVYYSFKQFYETISYSSNNSDGRFVSYNGSANEFKVKVTYGKVTECDISISPATNSIREQARTTGYYDICKKPTLLEKYGSTYDDFVSDKQFLYTTVTTSEQLYWAVENKVTPVFKSTTSRAYKIYAKAKSVLREIISDEMTDYEKALCIFDWIAINTSYDYTDYSSYSSTIANYPTKLACFYLEGVFMTGYSVCDGFSKSFSLMCNMLGIDAIRIVGDAKVSDGSSSGHAWNKVLLDIDPSDATPAQYYLVDITWTEIITSDNEEGLSHMYFGLSDEDTKDTHFAYSGRANKFTKYSASENLYYYTFQKFDYAGKTEDLVIDSTAELTDMFDYMLINSLDTMEVVIDYDYMVTEYNKYSATKYKTETTIDRTYYDDAQKFVKTEYDPQLDTFTYYTYTEIPSPYGSTYTSSSVTYNNYKLRTVFQENVMKKVKFQEQYFALADDNGLLEYAENKYGMLLVFTQNLLIDNEEEFVKNGENYTINPDGEVGHLCNYFNTKKITGTYYLYIKNSLLEHATGLTNLQKVKNMFSPFLTDANIEITFAYTSTGENTMDSTCTLFTMTVTEK